MTTPKATYFALPSAHGDAELWCGWEDGTLARRVYRTVEPRSLGNPGRGAFVWEPVPPADYDVIRAELTHPERTVPAPIAD